MASQNFSNKMRVYHRYLGFFLAGIMCIYAISGVMMIFRNTDTFKVEKQIERELPPNVKADELGGMLRMRQFQVTEETDSEIKFQNGSYNKATGLVQMTVMEPPTVLHKMEQMHKATSDRPLFYFNIFFGVSLLFFSLSAFWMFLPASPIFKKGMYFVLGGIVLALIMVLI